MGDMLDLTGMVVLVTGGTGSFGRQFARYVLSRMKPEKLIIFSRDEMKQGQMQQEFGPHPSLRFFIGDVRDKQRLDRAFHGVDVVVHAAALKQVPTLEYNPIEAVKTNVMGSENVIHSAIDQSVKKVIALSTDKAVHPINLYGATKLCAEKMFVAANAYSGIHGTKFSVVRYGNVLASRGSVVPLFLSQRETGVLKVTDDRMTRFWITLDEAVEFVLRSLEWMSGSEIFIPKIPSLSLMELAKTMGPQCRIERIGRRPGEKIHEILVAEEESENTLEYEDHYVVCPVIPPWKLNGHLTHGHPVKGGFRYSSNENTPTLDRERLKEALDHIVA